MADRLAAEGLAAPSSGAAAGRPGMSVQGRPLSSAAAGRPGAACRTHLLGGPASISYGAGCEKCPLSGISMDSGGGFGTAKLSGTTGGGFETVELSGTSDGGFDYIVPVPVHRDKEKARGFNQAEKMARHLGRRIGVPVLPRAIIRNRMTAAQRSLSAEDRYFNLEGAFSLNPKDAVKIRGSRILLLDDVYTTGATAHRCGDVLKEAGAARVDFIALATSNDFAYGFFDDGQC